MPSYMTKLKGQLNPQNPLNAVTFTCLITVMRLDSFDATRHSTLANLRQEKDCNGQQVTILHIPYTKALVLESPVQSWSFASIG
jgi:hypothetical protein